MQLCGKQHVEKRHLLMMKCTSRELILQNEDCDIDNADENGLDIQLLSQKTLPFKSEKMQRGKIFKTSIDCNGLW